MYYLQFRFIISIFEILLLTQLQCSMLHRKFWLFPIFPPKIFQRDTIFGRSFIESGSTKCAHPPHTANGKAIKKIPFAVVQ